ncbi:hypothetical protein NX801_02305 [Streptomyces sp. LP05-1]|uniref:Secreted protein n=1 Tax=Streptomyces pyxinae TaxID=2970734 RepID=A0ABT2CAV1_9ACTN|nr:hypothetical protein [Streptomyces sp. LP05-1]MCS0634514.1 hypothetical protein [Streptomyces sp. LP05-1]
MSMRRTTLRSPAAAVALTAVLSLAVAGCGADDGGGRKAGASSSADGAGDGAGDGKAGTPDAAGQGSPGPAVTLAEVRGQGQVVLVINQVERDSGGFVTVSGVIRNDGDQVRNTGGWAGSESAVVAANPNSVAGASLVDPAGRKRYYVLRDTDGRCLCTTGITPLQAGTSTPVFMQFPAPPNGTTEVDFTLPTFDTASIKISG